MGDANAKQAGQKTSRKKRWLGMSGVLSIPLAFTFALFHNEFNDGILVIHINTPASHPVGRAGHDGSKSHRTWNQDSDRGAGAARAG